MGVYFILSTHSFNVSSTIKTLGNHGLGRKGKDKGRGEGIKEAENVFKGISVL